MRLRLELVAVFEHSPYYHADDCEYNITDEGADDVVNDNDADAVADELVNLFFMHSIPCLIGLDAMKTPSLVVI